MRAIVLAALLGTLAFADQRSLKQSLGQSKRLAQVDQAAACTLTPVEAFAPALEALAVTEPDLAFCMCQNETLPGLGAGVHASNSL